jgi:hypothetical protein
MWLMVLETQVQEHKASVCSASGESLVLYDNMVEGLTLHDRTSVPDSVCIPTPVMSSAMRTLPEADLMRSPSLEHVASKTTS